ncbi:MAG: diguanylate cyclase [Gammaproteobacteria bacterium]|uniref:sensor domain-containing diguanylate cyclase n=1 Tax=Rhodoferax sp. TaxID=50421 RepID=UPI001DF67BB6|nr:diguanylate cyclase [Rhodoferax sp.]MBU3900503.1 diguanylate cyclase [Gammaproteobacteria bacterium]MBU3996408.1 diguanylate cyclase [Gammaproteobacteria bacterium]MBU4079948.1 diguanylate cyclase [Gammaproteobacteria bacterium]MBU4111734.1 diguanylate cyclase [Gammaproteobacteria bacterium]MBU4172026.1 diguanylate cyclase [Gammaproteobacteria bacterium]
MSNANVDQHPHYRHLTSAIWVLLIAAIFATVVLTQRSLSRLADSREVISHSLRVSKALSDMTSQIQDAETGQRGFLLSGRAPYLQPYYTALAQLRLSRAALGIALSEDPSALAPLDVLDKAIAAKLQDLDRAVSLKSEGRSGEAVESILTDSDNQTMIAVRVALRALGTDHVRRTNQVQTDIEQEVKNYYLILGVSILVNLILLAGLLQRFRQASLQSETAQHAVDERNVELSRLLTMAASRNAQVQGLSELSRFLQSCADLGEAAGLLKQHLPPLMRAASGALYLADAEPGPLHQAFTWGDKSYVDSFEAGECWAARLRQPFHQPFETGTASCAHLQSAYASEHNSNNIQCLPLMAYAELLGIVVLEADLVSDPQESLEIEGSRRFALEQVGLSIGNLKLRESLRQAAIRDVLTGLYNRRFFDESSQRELLRAVRQQAKGDYAGLALMMIDIDHFKRFNDEHGHEVGDQVLREVAQVLHRQTRGSDVAARFGGEEFTIVLADITEQLALERAQRVRQEVQELVLHAGAKDLGCVTISIGLAQFPAQGVTVDALLLAADKALYEAKAAGRNRVVVAS